MTALKIAILAVLFVATSGALFNDYFKKHKFLTVAASIVAIVSSYYLLNSIADDFARRQSVTKMLSDARSAVQKLLESGPLDLQPSQPVPRASSPQAKQQPREHVVVEAVESTEELPPLTEGRLAPGYALATEAVNLIGDMTDESPKVAFNRSDGIYFDGDYMVIDVALPLTASGYLYLDILADTGNVFHLLPEPMNQDNLVSAGGKVRIGVEEEGRGVGTRYWQVGAPFGSAYLFAVVSTKPLYPGFPG